MTRIFLILLVFISIPAFSQSTKSTLRPVIRKGTFLLGGSINGSFRNYSSNTPGEGTQNRGSVLDVKGDTRVGYFVLSNLAVGGQASINHFNYKNDQTGGGSHITYLLYGPFVRGYLKNHFFGEAGVGFGTDNSISNVDTKLLEGKIAVGYTHFLNTKVAIEPILSFRYLQNKYLGPNGYVRQTEIGPSFGLAIHAFLYRGNMGVESTYRRSKY